MHTSIATKEGPITRDDTDGLKRRVGGRLEWRSDGETGSTDEKRDGGRDDRQDGGLDEYPKLRGQ